MTAVLPTTAVGVFRDDAEAERAAEGLRRAGFREDQIGVARREGQAPPPAEPGTHAPEGGAAGVLAGGTVGGVLGAVAAGLVPGVGPLIGAGILAAVAGGAAAGAVAGGVVGTLIGLGIPEDEV